MNKPHALGLCQSWRCANILYVDVPCVHATSKGKVFDLLVQDLGAR